MTLWRTPSPVPPTTHGLKYLVVLMRRAGARLVGYDNERGKGDQPVHYEGVETPYAFKHRRAAGGRLRSGRKKVARQENEETCRSLRAAPWKRRLAADSSTLGAAPSAEKPFMSRHLAFGRAGTSALPRVLTGRRMELLRLRASGTKLLASGRWRKHLGRDYSNVHADVRKRSPRPACSTCFRGAAAR